MADATFPLATGSAATGGGTSSAAGSDVGGDVQMFQTNDGGEITIVGGRVTFDATPATAAYLSMFGGNEEDNGSEATASLQWWGNRLEEDAAFQYRSQTQAILMGLPVTTGNLPRIAAAVRADLEWMETRLGAEITVAVSLPRLNTVKIDGEIKIAGQVYTFSFLELWKAAVA